MTVDYSLGRTALAIQSLREPAAPLACVPNTIRQSIADVIKEQAAEITELKRPRDGYQKHLHECEQIAGKAALFANACRKGKALSLVTIT